MKANEISTIHDNKKIKSKRKIRGQKWNMTQSLS